MCDKAWQIKKIPFCYEYDGNGDRTAKYGEQAAAHGGKLKIRTSYHYDIRGGSWWRRRSMAVLPVIHMTQQGTE